MFWFLRLGFHGLGFRVQGFEGLGCRTVGFRAEKFNGPLVSILQGEARASGPKGLLGFRIQGVGFRV